MAGTRRQPAKVAPTPAPAKPEGITKSFSDELVEKVDRRFELGGEVYRWRYPHWEEMADIFDEDLAAATAANGNREIPTTRDSMARTFKRIKIMLEDEDRAKFDALTERTENPVPLPQYGIVYRWLIEVTSGRPTTPPSDSALGHGEPAA